MIRLFHSFLLGSVATILTNGVYWLATGDVMSVGTGVGVALILCSVFDAIIRFREIREQERLRELYDLPAYGE